MRITIAMLQTEIANLRATLDALNNRNGGRALLHTAVPWVCPECGHTSTYNGSDRHGTTVSLLCQKCSKPSTMVFNWFEDKFLLPAA